MVLDLMTLTIFFANWEIGNIVFCMVNNLSRHLHKKKRNDILVLGKGPRDSLENTAITAEAYNSANITKSRKNCFSLYYYAATSFLYANSVGL